MMTKDKQNEVEILAQFINKLTTEIFEDYTKHRYSFESEKQFTNAMNHVAIAMNKNTEILEKYIESNAKLIDILTE